MTDVTKAPSERVAREGTRAATVEASGGRLPCTVSTETPVDRYDRAGHRYSEVLSHAPGAVNLARAPLPLLEGHDTARTNIGVIANLRLEGNRLRGEVVLGTSARAVELRPDLESGIVSGLSVGYSLDEVEESADGATVTVTRWTPHECSIVACPADIKAGIGRSMATPPETNAVPQAPVAEQVNAVPTRGDEPLHDVEGSKMTEAEIQAAQAKFAEQAVQAERSRASGIRSACEKLGQRDLAEKLINDGTTLEAARALVIDAHAERTAKAGAPSGIEVGKESCEKYDSQVRGWLLEKSGCMDLVTRAAKLPGLSPVHAKALGNIDTDGGTLRGSRMIDIGRDILDRKGITTRGISTSELAKRALTSQFGTRAGFAPASDFSVLYENVMYKVLLASYLTAETTWQRVCKSETVSDPQRLSNRFRAGSFGTLDVVAENGEYQNKAIPDGLKFSIGTQKYGNIIGLSLEAMLSDDMGANSDLASRFGASYKLTLEKAFYALLAANGGLGPTMGDALPFFDASRANIGTGAALSIASIDADRLMMKRQKDISSNEYLNLSPRILLVPTELGTAARQYNLMQYSDLSNKYMLPNSVQGLFSDIIDTPQYTGTRRYTFADPAGAPAFVVAFLEGYGQAPTIESQEGWRTDGIEWKVKFFAKVQAFDPKGAMTNAGV